MEGTRDLNSSCPSAHIVVPDAGAQPCTDIAFAQCHHSLARSRKGLLHRCTQRSSSCDLGDACDERIAHGGTAFDIGFFNGDDTALLLMQGFRVVAIEANTALVAQGRARFASALKSGQLILLNRALASTVEEAGTTRPFYINRHNPEWSSFYRHNGCRPPRLDMRRSSDVASALGRDCDEHLVKASSCRELFVTYGVPTLLKLDIEGSERPCIDALLQVESRPSYIVMEAPGLPRMADVCARLHALGYDAFKWVDQAAVEAVHQWGRSSGPMGEFALDCHHGYGWRTLPSLVRLHRYIAYQTWRRRNGTSFDADFHTTLGKLTPHILLPSSNRTAAQMPADAARCTNLASAGWADVHARHRLVRARYEPFGVRHLGG